MSKLSKHLGKPEPLVINDEELYIEPLGTESLPDFFKAMKAFSGAEGEGASTEDMLKNIDDTGLNAIKKIIDDTLKASFPDESESDRKKFGMRYMMVLFPKIMEINLSDTGGSSEEKKKIDTIKRLQQRKNESASKNISEN